MNQSDLFLGKTDKSAREGIIIWCADRLQAVKWHNYKAQLYKQETMTSPAEKLARADDLQSVHKPARRRGQNFHRYMGAGPLLKQIAEFEHSLKQYPLIPMGTLDPYTPPVRAAWSEVVKRR